MALRRSLYAIILSLVLAQSVWAVPDSTITVTNTFTNATTADATEVNANFNDVSSPYNSHTHNDITKTTSNTFTIGDNAAGNKSLAVDNEFTTAPSIRYSNTKEQWQFSNDASSFVAFANLGTTTTTIGDGSASNISLAIDNSFTTAPSIRYNLTTETFQVSNDASTFGHLVTSASLRTSGRVLRDAGDVTTASTSLVDFTGASITLTTGTRPMLVGWAATCFHDTNDGIDRFNIDIDGTIQFGTQGLSFTQTTAGKQENCSFTVMTGALTAAEHTFKLQWSTNTGNGSVICTTTTNCTFWVAEVLK